MEDKYDSEPNFDLSFSSELSNFKSFCAVHFHELNPNFYRNLLPLSQTEVGDVGCIVKVSPIDCIDYLLNMGFTVGTELHVINTTITGSVVVELQDKCLGLSADVAQSILLKRFS